MAHLSISCRGGLVSGDRVVVRFAAPCCSWVWLLVRSLCVVEILIQWGRGKRTGVLSPPSCLWSPFFFKLLHVMKKLLILPHGPCYSRLCSDCCSLGSQGCHNSQQCRGYSSSIRGYVAAVSTGSGFAAATWHFASASHIVPISF